MMIDTASAAEWSQVDVGAGVVVASLVFIVARLVIFPAWSLVKLRRARARHCDGAVDAAFRPGAMVYTDGARFRVRDRDDCGDLIPDFARGRAGTVVTVEGPGCSRRFPPPGCRDDLHRPVRRCAGCLRAIVTPMDGACAPSGAQRLASQPSAIGTTKEGSNTSAKQDK